MITNTPWKRWSLLLGGLALFFTFLALDAYARGGGRGGRGGRGSRARGATRGRAGGVGRWGGNSFGMGRFKQGDQKTAKEWQAIQEQEERKALINERRDALMAADRTGDQEAFLAAKRLDAATSAGQPASVR